VCVGTHEGARDVEDPSDEWLHGGLLGLLLLDEEDAVLGGL